MENTPQKKVWLVTGCSTGFGQEIARAVLERGDFLVATARRLDHLTDLTTQFEGQLLSLQLDITDTENVSRVVAAAVRQFGRIDVLVNNAGYGLTGAVEEATDDETRDQFDTNVFGTLRLTREVLPQMRQQGKGFIIVLSSIAGLVSAPGMGLYNGTKFALEGIFEALSHEVGPLGIRVTIVEPGAFRTKFAGSSMKLTKSSLPDYEGTVGKTKRFFEGLTGTQPGDPAKGAQAIVALADHDEPPLRLMLGKAALKRVRDKLDVWQKMLDRWEPVSNSVDYESEA
ncbi:MAG: SDR family NAD(P)-dependent oxidoreductase [Cytophagaceae bacterium]|nr:SDR family NAD(P)-dependent oxidoreductase [Cytophagaceae bacterium]